MAFRSRFQEIMASRGVSVVRLAARLEKHSTNVYRYVNGACTPSAPLLVDIAATLDVSVDDLLAPIGTPIYGRMCVCAEQN